MGNNTGKQNTTIKSTKADPKSKLPYVRMTPNSSSVSSLNGVPSTINTTNVKDVSKALDAVHINTCIESDDGSKNLDIVIDHEQYVRLFFDPRIELDIGSLSYLIGYKMIYVVDAYRKRIPNVIAIATLKINSNNNAIFQSEGKHNKKDHYEMIDLSKKLGSNNFYDRDSQAESLRYTGGNMIAWEHSTKYCAHNVETLALTFCGKFKDVIKACHLYDKNMAFAESAYTYEENREPVIYEVGKTNYSKTHVPGIASGRCLDFFHFFLRPEYALDYGFWQFQLNAGRSDINRSEIVLGKKFSDIRKVNYSDCYKTGTARDRTDIKFTKTESGYVSNQVLKNIEAKKQLDQKEEKVVDAIFDELSKELENDLKPQTQSQQSQSQPTNTQLTQEEEDKVIDAIFDELSKELENKSKAIATTTATTTNPPLNNPFVTESHLTVTEDIKVNWVELKNNMNVVNESNTPLSVPLDVAMRSNSKIQPLSDESCSDNYNEGTNNNDNHPSIYTDKADITDGIRLRSVNPYNTTLSYSSSSY